MKLLVGIDFSDASDTVLARAKELACAMSASVLLVHAACPEPDFMGLGPGPQSVRDVWAKEFREEHRQIQDMAKDFADIGIHARGVLVQGPTVETIIEEADKQGADMIVLGTHGHSTLRQLLLGSVSEGVLHATNRSVLIVPTRPEG